MSKTEKGFKEIIFKGVPVSDGIAIGRLFFLKPFQNTIIPEFSINSSSVEKEIARYRRAILSSREDLHDLQYFLANEGSTEAVSIIDTHIQMLEDPFMTTFMEKKIRQMMKNTESVFRSVMTEYEKEFNKVTDNFFKQRLLDVKDLSQRILRNLYPKKQISLQDMPEHSVILTKELAPSNAAEVSVTHVKGLITEIGGPTSHAALIARSKRIPYIANVNMDALLKYQGAQVIIDGKTGEVIIHPSKDTLTKYRSEKNDIRSSPPCPFEKKGQITTLDGCKIELFANVESLEDLKLLTSCGAEGVGLFRSEFLLFGKELFSFSEEEQYLLYSQIMGQAAHLPVVFRTFDVGGDKGHVSRYKSEPNPALGCRGIRFLLRNREIFTLQLRALLRVSRGGHLSLLLPFITDISELIEAKTLIEEVRSELRSQGYEVAKTIPIGSMIEVPSAVMMCDCIARECDFISIGTNDLIQHTLAADRTTQEAQAYYKPTHPSIIRMIYHVVQEAGKQNTPVSLCGEMASDPLLIPLLLGLGIRKFSCALQRVPLIRKMIANISIEEVTPLIDEVRCCETPEEINVLFLDRYQETVASISSLTHLT